MRRSSGWALGRSTRPTNYGRKDISWLLDKVPLETKFKLAYLVVASKYKGHGTAMISRGNAEYDPIVIGMVIGS